VRTALVIGGSGPSGPHLINGLVDRGLEVSMFHTGRHEISEVPDVEHIHGDPFSEEGLTAALAGRSFDVVVATYGSVRRIAKEIAGRCDQFIYVGGTPVYLGFIRPDLLEPHGLQIHLREDAERVPPDGVPDAIYGVGAVRRTEDGVFDLHRADAFRASVFRYPSIYGPRNPHAWEWSAIRRVLDGRSFMFLPDRGLAIQSRLSSWNAAHSLLLAVDHPDAAAGEAFNCADDDQFSLFQWTQMIVNRLAADMDLLAMPGDIPGPGKSLLVFHYNTSPHVVVDTTKIRAKLGYRDVKKARDGLAETVDWMVENREASSTWPVLDTFDYLAEDRFLDAWTQARDLLIAAGSTYDDSAAMQFPQTAAGSRGNADAARGD
jgi:nucleoside-diphosphate-sugar epimerase